MEVISTASNGKAETVVSNAQEKECPSRDFFPSAPGFKSHQSQWVQRWSWAWPGVLGASQGAAGLQEGGGGGRKEGQVFIWPRGKPNWEDSNIGISTLMLCMCSCLNFFRNNYTWLHFALQFIQMENVKKWWCNVSVKNICPLPPPAHGSEGALEKRTFLLPLSDFCIDRALTNVASINLFSFIAHVLEHFKSWIP